MRVGIVAEEGKPERQSPRLLSCTARSRSKQKGSPAEVGQRVMSEADSRTIAELYLAVRKSADLGQHGSKYSRSRTRRFQQHRVSPLWLCPFLVGSTSRACSCCSPVPLMIPFPTGPHRPDSSLLCSLGRVSFLGQQGCAEGTRFVVLHPCCCWSWLAGRVLSLRLRSCKTTLTLWAVR